MLCAKSSNRHPDLGSHWSRSQKDSIQWFLALKIKSKSKSLGAFHFNFSCQNWTNQGLLYRPYMLLQKKKSFKKKCVERVRKKCIKYVVFIWAANLDDLSTWEYSHAGTDYLIKVSKVALQLSPCYLNKPS